MKLPRPFFRLPLRFDAARLREEVAQFTEADWQRHPSEYRGNSAIRLITANGEETDGVSGRMEPTPQLERCPYIRQVLGAFGVVWSRSRLMRLGPRSTVPAHADINHHWFHRVRLHIPVATWPEVRFHCGGASVHMAAGECWVFDNWRVHSVDNPTERTRVHLVADTVGTAPFWQMVRQSQSAEFERNAGPPPKFVSYEPGRDVRLSLERYNLLAVLPPSEIDYLVLDLRADLALEQDTPAGRETLGAWHALLEGFCHDWRAAWTLHADTAPGRPLYRQLCEGLLQALDALPVPAIMASNRMPARVVLIARVLKPAVYEPVAAPAQAAAST